VGKKKPLPVVIGLGAGLIGLPVIRGFYRWS